MNPLLIVGGLLVVGGTIVLLGGKSEAKASPKHRAVKGLPAVSRITYRVPDNGVVEILVDGKRSQDWKVTEFGVYKTSAESEYARKSIGAAFAIRRMALPPDADKLYLDKYSKSLFVLPTWLENGDIIGFQYRLHDEFGRVKPGHVGFGGSIVDSLGRLADNPLAQVVIQAAILYATGPGGLAAYGAIRAYAERGSELTFKDVALGAARSAAVGYCGVACGAAFDFGVGVASGDSVDVAAEKAITGQLTPEQRQYYEAGKHAVLNA
jgi:hypothetical protein